MFQTNANGDDYHYDDSLDEFDILYDLSKGYNGKPKLGKVSKKYLKMFIISVQYNSLKLLKNFKHGAYEALMHGRKEEDYIDEARKMEENR